MHINEYVMLHLALVGPKKRKPIRNGSSSSRSSGKKQTTTSTQDNRFYLINFFLATAIKIFERLLAKKCCILLCGLIYFASKQRVLRRGAKPEELVRVREGERGNECAKPYVFFYVSVRELSERTLYVCVCVCVWAASCWRSLGGK